MKEFPRAEYQIVRHRRLTIWKTLRTAGLYGLVGLTGAVVSLAMGLAFGMDFI